MNSPCEQHPNTGGPCSLRRLDKNNVKCLKCRHRVQYVRSIDGHTDSPEYLNDPPAPILPPKQHEIKPCWWAACERPARSHGLCNTHYRYFTNAKISVWLKDTTLESREGLFQTIMKCANKHKIPWQEAVLILLDEGAVQYRKRS